MARTPGNLIRFPGVLFVEECRCGRYGQTGELESMGELEEDQRSRVVSLTSIQGDLSGLSLLSWCCTRIANPVSF